MNADTERAWVSDHDQTDVLIDPEIMNIMGHWSARSIRAFARSQGIELTARSIDGQHEERLLAELSRKMKERRHGRKQADR